MTLEIYCADKIPSLSGQLEFSQIGDSTRLFSNSVYFSFSPVQCRNASLYIIMTLLTATVDEKCAEMASPTTTPTPEHAYSFRRGGGGVASVQIRLSFFFPSIRKACTKKSENGGSLGLLVYCFIVEPNGRRRTSEHF